MEQQVLIVLSIVWGLLFLFIQRADPSRRKAVRNFVWFMLLPIVFYVWWRSAWLEAVAAAGIALVLNVIFWVLIGRYNPAKDSEDIRVLGMDD
jgi:uncharacterized membrane protein